MANYLEDNDLLYEIILSKGKGQLTRKAENYFILIAQKTIIKLRYRYKSDDEEMECLQHGLLQVFSNWKSFNEKKFSAALPYITEVFKRGAAAMYNKLRNKKSYHDSVPKMISIDSSNEGKGLHNI